MGIDRFLLPAYLRATGKNKISITGEDIRFYISNRSELNMIDNIQSERTVIDDLISNLNQDDVFFDVGANIGIYLCIVSEIVTKGEAIGFEPHDENIRKIEANTELNGLDPSVYKYALSDSNGTTELTIDWSWGNESGAGKHALSTEQGEGSKTVEIETITGDKFIKSNNVAPDVMKIDVEGAEMKVLRGFNSALSEGVCRMIYCEVHPEKMSNYGDSKEELFSYLEEMGFAVQEIQSRNGEIFIKATR